MANKIKSQGENSPLLDFIQRIKEGTISPKSIDKETRLEIVEFFTLQGQDVTFIAQFLAVSDKTVRRDLIEIREKNALTPDPQFAKAFIGQMVVRMNAHIIHLMKLARSREGSLGEKLQAEYMAHRVSVECTKTLQSLGYLPLQPQALINNVYYNLNNDEAANKMQEIKESAIELSQVMQDCGVNNHEVDKALLEIKDAVKECQPPKKDEETHGQSE